MLAPQMGVVLVQAIVLGIEQYYIHTHIAGHCTKMTCNLKQHTYSTATVVCSGKRLAVVGLIGVAVGPWAGIPMCTKHYTVALLGVELRHDVTCLEAVAVIGPEVHILGDDCCSVALQLGDEVVAAFAVCGSAWHARAEIHLRLDEAVGTVGIEYGHNDSRLNNSRHALRLLGLYNLLLAR